MYSDRQSTEQEHKKAVEMLSDTDLHDLAELVRHLRGEGPVDDEMIVLEMQIESCKREAKGETQ